MMQAGEHRDVSQSDSNKGPTPDEAERFLCFTLGAEFYAMPLLAVKEVIAVPEFTPVPQTPNYFLGIMNLRGQVISVVDLRVKLGIKPAQVSETAVIICDLRPNCMGIVVDAIHSVLHPKAQDRGERPEMQGSKSAEYVNGVFRHDGKLVLLMDMGRVLSTADYQLVANANAPRQASKRA